MVPADFRNHKIWDTISVTWMDIHVNGEELDPKDYIENYEPCIRRTAGYFLGVKHGHLFIAETDDRRAHTDHVAERINSFPLSIVVTIQ